MEETLYRTYDLSFVALSNSESTKIYKRYVKGYLLKVAVPGTNNQGFMYVTRFRKKLVCISKTALIGYNKLLREVYKIYEW